YLHIRTVDKVGRWSSAAHMGPFVIAKGGPPPPPPPPPPAKKCVVPKVTGLALKKAKAKIAKAHCRVGKISYAASSKAKKGRVLKQSPKAGKRLSAGARVKLIVGKGKKH